MKKAVLIPTLSLFVASLLLVSLALANFMPPIPDLPHICIKSDGTVEPSDAPIRRVGNTFTLTRDLMKENVIEVQANNLIIDGGGHTIQGMAPSGIIIYGRNSITIKNFTIREFNSGISIRYSYNIVITGNNFSGNDNGITLDYAVNNTILENIIIGNGDGILTFNDCDYNRIIRNQFTQNKYAGLWFEQPQDGTCDYNSIVQNTITQNTQEGAMCRSLSNSLFAANTFGNNGYGNPDTVEGYGIFMSASGNTLYYNNFLYNREQALDLGNNNAWDNSAKGNYWSNYTGTDANSDGVGDSSFMIERDSSDNHPLIVVVNILEIELPLLPVAYSISIPTPPEPTPSPSGNPFPTAEPTTSPSPTAVPSPIPAPTGQFDGNAEFKSGTIPRDNVKFWYVWVNSSGTQLVYYALLSDTYNPPIMSFLGQHFQTETGTDVFVGNTKSLIEIYQDRNGDGIPQADFTTGQIEILYHLIVNSSVSYEIKPLEKTVEEGIPHYRWGITYKTIDGFFFKADMSGFAFKAMIDFMRFEYDFYITQNASHVKTSFAISNLNSSELGGTGSISSLEDLSLSLLYATSTSSPKPYTTYVNGEAFDSTSATEPATATHSGQIMVENVKAYEFLFDENYTLTRGEMAEAFEVRTEAAASTSVPSYLKEMQWVFSDFENVLDASALFPAVVGLEGRLNLDLGASKFLYRICYPVWDGGALEHDPTGVAYFLAIDAPSGSANGESGGSEPFHIDWMVTALTAGVTAMGITLLVYLKKRNKS